MPAGTLQAMGKAGFSVAGETGRRRGGRGATGAGVRSGVAATGRRCRTMPDRCRACDAGGRARTSGRDGRGLRLGRMRPASACGRSLHRGRDQSIGMSSRFSRSGIPSWFGRRRVRPGAEAIRHCARGRRVERNRTATWAVWADGGADTLRIASSRSGETCADWCDSPRSPLQDDSTVSSLACACGGLLFLSVSHAELSSLFCVNPNRADRSSLQRQSAAFLSGMRPGRVVAVWHVAGWRVAGWRVAGWHVAGWHVAGGCARRVGRAFG